MCQPAVGLEKAEQKERTFLYPRRIRAAEGSPLIGRGEVQRACLGKEYGSLGCAATRALLKHLHAARCIQHVQLIGVGRKRSGALEQARLSAFATERSQEGAAVS